VDSLNELTVAFAECCPAALMRRDAAGWAMAIKEPPGCGHRG
jgi:hypothetical protein